MNPKKHVELIMGFVSSSLKQKRHNFTVANHMLSCLFARWDIAKYIRGVFARNNSRSLKPRVRVFLAGEEVARNRSGGKRIRRTEKKRKQRMRRKKETKEKRKTKKGEGTSRAIFIPFTSLLVRAIDEEQREGRQEDEEGRNEEKAEHTKVKPLRFTGDFMA